MFDTAGSRMSFPVVAGVAETFRASFWMGSTVGMSVLGATFQAACYVAHGDERGELVAVLPVEHDGSRENAVLVTVPELEHGHYHWELRATDPEGRESRLLYGTLSALNAADAEYVVRLAEESELRELSVQMADGHAGPLMLRWQSSNVAAGQAAVAAGHASAAAGHAAAAEAAAGRAEGAAEAAEGARAAIDGRFVHVDAVLAVWDGKLASVIVANPITGTLWIGGKDTGAKYTGEPGKSPYIGTDGHWMYWDDVKKVWLRSEDSAVGKDGYSPQINALGNWMTLDPVTGGIKDSGVCAMGKDGLDGTAIRRKLIETVAQLPTEEERGVYYYVPKEAAKAKIMVQTYEANDIGLYINGRHVYVEGNPTSEEEWAEAWLAAINSTIGGLTCISCIAAGPPGWHWARLDADFIGDYANGTTIEYGLCKYGEYAGQTFPKGFQPWHFSKIGSNGGYDIYAWLDPDGWVCVGDANDIATAEIYGLMKYGTDSLIESGSPVGRNADGQAMVPMADTTVPGAVKPSSERKSGDGGKTWIAEDGAVYAELATPVEPGCIRMSYNAEVPGTDCLGLQPDGCTSVAPAGVGRYGVVKAAGVVFSLGDEPYVFSNCVADSSIEGRGGEIVSNLVHQGAIKQMGKSGWKALAENGDMPWLSAEEVIAWPPAGSYMTIGDVRVTLSSGADAYDYNATAYLQAWASAVNATAGCPATAAVAMENENPVLTLTAKEDGFAGNELGLAASSEALRLSGDRFSGGTVGTPPGVARFRMYWTRVPGDAGLHTFLINGREFSMTLISDADADREREVNNNLIQALVDDINAAGLPCEAFTRDVGEKWLLAVVLLAREPGSSGNNIVVQLVKAGQKGYVFDWKMDGSATQMLEGESRNLREGADALPGACATAEVRVGENEASGPWFGLHTSRSFSQSAERGLELKAATGEVLGGVLVSPVVTGSGEYVPTCGAVLSFCLGNFYRKDETYSQGEADGRFLPKRYEAVIEQLGADIRDEVLARIAGDGDLRAAVAKKLAATDRVDALEVMSLQDYTALKVRNPKCIYLLTED